MFGLPKSQEEGQRVDPALETKSHSPPSAPDAPAAAPNPSSCAKLPLACLPLSLTHIILTSSFLFLKQTKLVLTSFVPAVTTAWNPLPQALCEASPFLALRSQPRVPSPEPPTWTTPGESPVPCSHSPFPIPPAYFIFFLGNCPVCEFVTVPAVTAVPWTTVGAPSSQDPAAQSPPLARD